MDKQTIEQQAIIYADTYGFLKDTVVIKAAFVAGAEFALPKWISIREGLPDKNCSYGASVLATNGKITYVLVYTSGMQIDVDLDNGEKEEDYDMDENTGTFYLKPGWYECEEQSGGMYDEIWIARTPTHWMPLPLKPTK
jgi:hypothetical protein